MNGLEIATWVLVVILSIALFIFLVLGIVLLVKLVQLAGEAKRVVATGQQIADKAEDVVDNVRGVTSFGTVVQAFTDRILDRQKRRYRAEDNAMDEAEKAVVEAAERIRHARKVEQDHRREDKRKD